MAQIFFGGRRRQTTEINISVFIAIDLLNTFLSNYQKLFFFKVFDNFLWKVCILL